MGTQPLSASGNGDVYHVAIIDQFHRKAVDADGDGIADFSHGEVVEATLRSELGDRLVVHRYDIDGTITLNKINEQLLAVNQDSQSTPFDAVNISISQNIPYRKFGDQCSCFLSPENIGSDPQKWIAADLARKRYVRKDTETGFIVQDFVRTEMLMEGLVQRRGIPVFVGAGNDSKGFNGLSLTAASTVGATPGPDEEYNDTFSHNALVDHEANPYITFTPVDGGYDLNKDGVLDLPTEVELTPGEHIKVTDGTSFATPRALAEEIQSQ